MKLCNCRWVDGAAVTVPKLQNGSPSTVTLTWLSSRSGHCRNNKLQAPHTCCWWYYRTCMASSAENKSFREVLKYVINTRSHCPKLMKFINELSKQMKFERAQLRIFFKKKFGSRSKSEKRSFTQLIHEIVLYGLIIIKYVFLSFVFKKTSTLNFCTEIVHTYKTPSSNYELFHENVLSTKITIVLNLKR